MIGYLDNDDTLRVIMSTVAIEYLHLHSYLQDTGGTGTDLFSPCIAFRTAGSPGLEININTKKN